jgi:hypothetical protein
LDATDPDTFVLSGNSVLQWLDKRYNGKKAYMHDDARCPDYDTRIINGHPAVYFDDVDDGMQTNISLSDPYTIFVVYNVQQKDLSSTRVLQ